MRVFYRELRPRSMVFELIALPLVEALRNSVSLAMRHFLSFFVLLVASSASWAQTQADLGDPKDSYNSAYYCRNFPKAHVAFQMEIAHNRKTPDRAKLLKSFGKLDKNKARFAYLCAASNLLRDDEEWNAWMKSNVLSALYEIEKKRYPTETASGTANGTAQEANAN